MTLLAVEAVLNAKWAPKGYPGVDADDTVIVEDVLDGDTDDEDDADVTPEVRPEQLGRGRELEWLKSPTKQVLRGKRARGVRFSRCLSIIARRSSLTVHIRKMTSVLYFLMCMQALGTKFNERSKGLYT